MVGLISDRWLGLLLVWVSDCNVFSEFQCFGWSKPLDLRKRLTKNAEHKDVGRGWVSGYCCCVYFKFLDFFFFFFMWIGLFFKVYGFDLLEVSVEDRDFE